MDSLPVQESPPRLADLAAADPESRARVLELSATPLVDGQMTTFVHVGEAEAVHVRHYMARFPAVPPMQRIAPGLHAVTVALPERSRIEYKLAATLATNTTEDVDPFNPEQATDPFGANSVTSGPGYVTPWWAAPAPARDGALRRGFVQARAFAQRRSVRWYQPPETGGRLPLLVVHDGGDFVQHGGIVGALDHLIGAEVIPPIVAALIDPGERLVEYADDPRHAGFIRDVVGAAIRRHCVDPDPNAHVYLGASLGGVAALSAAQRKGPVGGLVLLSGSFVTTLGGPMNRGEHFRPVVDFMRRFTARPGRPATRIYQSCGSYEGLAPEHRAFEPVLRQTGAALVSEEVRDGHHWHNWRDRLASALIHTLPSKSPVSPGTVRT